MMGWGYWNGGMHAGWWMAMGFFWIAVVVAGVWGLGHLFPRGADSRNATTILKERHASGEITLSEYKKILAELAPETSGGSDAGA